MVSNSVASSSYLVMDDSVTYTVSFQTNYGFRAVSVLIPVSISVDSTAYQSTCAPNTYSQCELTTATDGSGQLNLTFTGTISSGGTYSVSWDGNVNPNSMRTTSQFTITTYSLGWAVEKSVSGTSMTLTMTTPATLESSAIVPSSFTNNALISVTIDYSLPSHSPSGTVTLTVPSVLGLSGASCNLTGCVIVASKVTIPFSNSDTSSLHSFKLLLSNVVNAPSYASIPAFTLSLATASFSSISDSMAAWTNTATSSFSTSVTASNGFLGENALFTFQLS